MSRVLLVGQDELLQETRAAVVRQTGADAVCSTISAALALQADLECEVVILCHSVPEPLSAALAATMHSRWPKTRILLITAAPTSESAYTDAIVDAISSADPDELVRRTGELLGWRTARKAETRKSTHFPPGRISA